MSADCPLLGSHVLLQGERVDGDLVVQTSAGYHLSWRSEGAGHHPGGGHGDCVLLVGGERVPDDQLSVLRGRDQVALVQAPVDAEDLGAVAFQAPPDFDVQTLNGFYRFRNLPNKMI